MTKLIFILSLLAISSFATWSNPVDIGPPINPDACHPTFSPDGNVMYFYSYRTGGSDQSDLWRSVKVNNIWQTPVNLGSVVNTSSYESSPYLTENGTKLYFDSDCISLNYFDIYFSQVSGMTIGPKQNIGSPINTANLEGSPVLANNGNTMFFVSDRAGGVGNYDIWMSTRSGSTWNNPTNMGLPVNSTYADFPCWVSNDGNSLVFSSDRPGGQGLHDIWYTIKSGGVWGTPFCFEAPINSLNEEYNATFRCNNGQIGGIMYLSRAPSGPSSLFTSVDSNYINVSPASVGELKALYR
jgi:Tol biopolymer transport system component